MNDLTEGLDAFARSFERNSLWAVKAILEADADVREPFLVTLSPPTGSNLFCLIPNSNTEYLAQLAVGIAKEDLPGLFPAETEPRQRLDALGEMSNVISGLLMADEEFLGRFGHLKPSTPFFSEGAFTDRLDAGVRGSVTVNGFPMTFHLTIRRAGRETWHGEPIGKRD